MQRWVGRSSRNMGRGRSKRRSWEEEQGEEELGWQGNEEAERGEEKLGGGVSQVHRKGRKGLRVPEQN